MHVYTKKDDVRISVGDEQPDEQTSTETDKNYMEIRDQQEQPSTQEPIISSRSFPASNKMMSDGDRDLINGIKKAEKAEAAGNDDERSQTKIQKVPESILRKEIFKNQYCNQPKAIAIGPYYAKCSELKKTELKRRLAARFIRSSGKTVEILLPEFKKNFTADELKKLFKEKVIKDNNDQGKLSRMLFLDGCSVLQFIDSYVKNEIKESDDEIINGKADEIRHDLFLLENQIPFKVLVILMRLSEKGVELAINLYRFVSMNTMAPVIYSLSRLDQKRSSLLQQKKEKKQLFEGNNNTPVHLLDLLRSELLFDDDCSKESSLVNDREEGRDYKCSFRNVNDLKSVGIKMVPEYSRGLRSVSFSSRLYIFGQLKLPPLIVDESTKQKLLNLVAYEMSPGNHQKNYAVSSYLRLLDSLIDSEQDVKDLRSAHILRNLLSSDEEVARLFNSLGRSLVSHDAYSSVKMEIQKYYEIKVVKWKAELTQEYCRSPWAIVGVLAILAGLILTGIQTYYSVNPKKGH
ncbi:UPF0481 protein At3g47200-like [Humulus lupulus]|uniref:UPF0481 protein At3g47200-like n=1 Tax=Humulus lupulus TaxID=3486 RepID=UPI002B407024|nr:UPF0481 protein At3g47200-like [Humulus lupulus]